MSEPSEEALEKAERIVSHLASERKWGVHEARDHIANAMQELMDERDDWKTDRFELAEHCSDLVGLHDEQKQRAEKAEADLKASQGECGRLFELYEVYSSGCDREIAKREKAEADYLQVAQALGYAECPEGQDGWHTAEPEVLAQRFRELETRSVIAEERLAELVRRVREWDRDVHPFEWSPRLDAILAEFVVKP